MGRDSRRVVHRRPQRQLARGGGRKPFLRRAWARGQESGWRLLSGPGQLTKHHRANGRVLALEAKHHGRITVVVAPMWSRAGPWAGAASGSKGQGLAKGGVLVKA